MAFFSSDSPEEGLGAGDGVSGTPVAAGSAEEVLMAMVGEGEDAKGVLTEVKRGHSASELSVGVGRGLGVKGDLLELGQDWLSSVNSTKFTG